MRGYSSQTHPCCTGEPLVPLSLLEIHFGSILLLLPLGIDSIVVWIWKQARLPAVEKQVLLMSFKAVLRMHAYMLVPRSHAHNILCCKPTALKPRPWSAHGKSPGHPELFVEVSEIFYKSTAVEGYGLLISSCIHFFLLPSYYLSVVAADQTQCLPLEARNILEMVTSHLALIMSSVAK
jgi:hypothetical protein